VTRITLRGTNSLQRFPQGHDGLAVNDHVLAVAAYAGIEYALSRFHEREQSYGANASLPHSGHVFHPQAGQPFQL
jgi:hypothetical protein